MFVDDNIYADIASLDHMGSVSIHGSQRRPGNEEPDRRPNVIDISVRAEVLMRPKFWYLPYQSPCPWVFTEKRQSRFLPDAPPGRTPPFVHSSRGSRTWKPDQCFVKFVSQTFLFIKLLLPSATSPSQCATHTHPQSFLQWFYNTRSQGPWSKHPSTRFSSKTAKVIHVPKPFISQGPPSRIHVLLRSSKSASTSGSRLRLLASTGS
jgi:hypothetical protein